MIVFVECIHSIMIDSQVLEGLLASIRASRPQDRVVVVSNFISTLDSIQVYILILRPS
jgi:hypothetical protein